MFRPFSQKSRNLFSLGVSILVLLVTVLGTAFAERAPMPQQAQSRGPYPKIQPQGPVRHDTKFHSVPGTKLQIRAIQYDGSTNGTLTVQVKNLSKTAEKFSANGLYFVPEGDPDSAPQRLGAVGPMQIVGSKDGEKSELAIAAGATVELNLDVFCIDSHRSSPSPQNVFNVGGTRMPKELASKIERRANQAVEEAKSSGAAAPRPAAKGKIQSEVWQSRDADWVELQGEGKQEVGKRKK